MEYKKNADGTDMLDDNGNPIPVENTNDKDSESETIKGLVEEIKTLREEKNLYKALLEKPEDKISEPKAPETEEEKLEALLEKKLAEREKLSAQANKLAALEKFVMDNKEFHPENDPAGLKRSALQKKFNQFNTEGLVSVDDFLSVIGDAKRLLIGNDEQSKSSNDNQSHYSDTPTPQSKPLVKSNEALSPLEKKLAQQTGRTEEAILKMKEKHPDMLRNLLEHVRD